MGHFLILGALTLAVAGAVMWGRHRARTERTTANAVVLRAIDDRVLWCGIGCGSSVMTVGLLAAEISPWLAWHWSSSASESLVNHGDGVGGGITLAMFVGTLVFPACVMVGLPDVLLLAGAMGATRRAAYGLKPRPALVFLLVAAAWVVMSVPLAGALAYASWCRGAVVHGAGVPSAPAKRGTCREGARRLGPGGSPLAHGQHEVGDRGQCVRQ